MIQNGDQLEKFNQDLVRREKISYKKAVKIFEALFQEAVHLGAINSQNILDGIDVDIRIAKAINSIKPS